MQASADYRSVKPLLDALVRIKGSDRQRVYERTLQVIGQLEVMSDNGSSYTPASDLGFGSENAASIADAILGRRASSGKIKSTFARLTA